MEDKNVKFIERIETATNPKDIYYVNYENMIQTYFFVMAIGLLIIGYMIIF